MFDAIMDSAALEKALASFEAKWSESECECNQQWWVASSNQVAWEAACEWQAQRED